MKPKLTKIAFLGYLLLTNFIVFAKDDGGDILGDGTVENDGPSDPGDVPINSYLIWLTLIAILFSVYLYKTKKVKA